MGVSIVGENGDYKYVNPKFVDMFGYTLDEILTGREWFRKAYPDKEYRNQVIAAWINVIKETKFGPCRVLTFTARCKDGSKKVIQFFPVKMKTGEHFVIYEDLTAQRKLEAQLIQAQKMEAIGRLAGGVAHDFNNLLTAILGNAGLLLMRLDEKDPLREDLEEIRDAGDRAASLTRQLLAFSRKQPLRLAVLNLNEAITDMNKMLQRLIGEDVEVGTYLGSDLVSVKADPGQMQQVMMNLAINAKDAMPRGGKLTIETKNVYLDEAYWQEHEGPLHLMITDVVMPGMSGRELAERIQSMRPEIRVIYMSGDTDNSITDRGVLPSGINFLEKPFSPESLMRKVRTVLDS